MVYKDIPLANDDLDISQGDIRGNFAQANTTMGVNHYPFNVVSNNGKHKFVEMPNGALPPGLAANETTLYSKADSNGNPQLYMTRGNSGVEIPMSAGLGPSIAQQGTTFLPGNVFLQWGLVVVPVGQINGTVTFTFPFPNEVLNITMQPLWAGLPSDLTLLPGIQYLAGTSPTKTKFNWILATGSSQWRHFYYLAIGR